MARGAVLPTLQGFARSLFEGIDRPLAAVVLALTAIGLATLYSALSHQPERMAAQLAHVAIALAAALAAARLPPQLLVRAAPAAYLGALALLVAVALFGDVVNGARRWLNLGVARFQPSELMKLVLPFALAAYFHQREAAPRGRDFVVAALLVALPVALVARQPDLGTALLIAAAGGYVIFFAGLSWKPIAALALAAVAALPAVWGLLHDYQRRRVITLLDPTQDPLGAGYHTIQSTIAVGSGGVAGKGWLHGTQAHLEFIPERHTDFIFAVYAEEFGFLGSGLLLLLYGLLVARGFAIAAAAATVFGRLLAAALTLLVFTYAFVNMGMVAGILPVVGIPLPFLSYGGTAMATLYLAVGLLMNVHRHRRLVQT